MFRQILNDKIGNLLIYLADNIKDLSLMKALKLLYIIDETSMKETGVPVTWLEYKVWEHGPVAPEIWAEIKNGITCGPNTQLVGKYIQIQTTTNPVNPLANPATYISSTGTFDDSEFTDYEMMLLDKVVKSFGNKTVEQLVIYLHQENSLWDVEKKKNGLDFKLQGGISNVSIPLNTLIKDDTEKQDLYASAFESLSFEDAVRSPMN
jgi:uncharacterized phage-associated protein